MAQMATAIGAIELRAHHAVAGVGGGCHRPRLGVVKTGPAGAAIKLGRGIEQFGAAAGALELARALLRVQRTGTGALGAVLTQNPVLFGGQWTKGFGVCLDVIHGRFLSLPNTYQTAKSYVYSGLNNQGFAVITICNIPLSRPVFPKANPAS